MASILLAAVVTAALAPVLIDVLLRGRHVASSAWLVAVA